MGQRSWHASWRGLAWPGLAEQEQDSLETCSLVGWDHQNVGIVAWLARWERARSLAHLPTQSDETASRTLCKGARQTTATGASQPAAWPHSRLEGQQASNPIARRIRGFRFAKISNYQQEREGERTNACLQLTDGVPFLCNIPIRRPASRIISSSAHQFSAGRGTDSAA